MRFLRNNLSLKLFFIIVFVFLCSYFLIYAALQCLDGKVVPSGPYIVAENSEILRTIENKDKKTFAAHATLTQNRTCGFSTDSTPSDIKVIDLYKNLPNAQNPQQIYEDDEEPLKVFVVPHSHNDPGWKKTFVEYYEQTTKHILSNILEQLPAHPEMRFIWAEISYFAKWYEPLPASSKNVVRSLIRNKQLEIVSGGWVMPDEANSHWSSLLMQLTEGHMWLKQHLNITPHSSWAIDPFGYSPSMSYILKNSGFENHLIQRVHYLLKRKFGAAKNFEFQWRQLWDKSGETDLFTHMMPYLSYGAKYTCGPDPEVCSEFNFERQKGFLGVIWPWTQLEYSVDDKNVGERSALIVDQWKKKAALYRTHSVLIPLGDDFRYSRPTEWDDQRSNYQRLFDHINENKKFGVVAKFATLSEYFDSVHAERPPEKFPSLKGDFFTYADEEDDYWSGYFTSRPFHKRMDRVLLHYIRSAEILNSWIGWTEFDETLQMARRELSLFQHHDGITGTAKDYVVQDYACRMKTAIEGCKAIMQHSVYRLMTNNENYSPPPDYRYSYFDMDDSRWPQPDTGRAFLNLKSSGKTKNFVVFHNSLPQAREEVVEILVSTPFVKVSDFEMNPIAAQISPVFRWSRTFFTNKILPAVVTEKYRLNFLVKVPPMGLVTYVVQAVEFVQAWTTYAKVRIRSDSISYLNFGSYPVQVMFEPHNSDSLQLLGKASRYSFDKFGMLKGMSLNDDKRSHRISVEFLKYGVEDRDVTSGAYLFHPNGPATPMELGSPTVVIAEGKIESRLTSGLPFAIHESIITSDADLGLELRNLIDIGNRGNTEIVMRIKSGISSDNTFYTDLNAMQIIKRKRFEELPIQANYYPIPSSIYIEDDTLRLTVVSGQPLGGSSLKSGEIEIMQDRRLDQGDARGLGQGVQDNLPVLHLFRVILERRDDCKKQLGHHLAGYSTVEAHHRLQTLLHPVDKFIWTGPNEWKGLLKSFGENHRALDEGFDVGVMRSLTNEINENDGKEIGIVISHPFLDECGLHTKNYSSNSNVNLKALLDLSDDSEVFSTSLTLLEKENLLKAAEDLKFCPMDVKGFIIRR